MQVGGIYEQRDAQSITYILDNPSLIYPTGYKVLQSQGGKGVLKCNHLTHNGKDKLVYDISKFKTLVSLATSLDGVAFLHVFINLIDSIIMVKNNGFMQYDNVDLNFGNIYIDCGNYKAYLIYVPINIGQFSNDVTYFEDRFRYCANEFFMNYINSNDVTLMEIRNIVCNGQNKLEDMKGKLAELKNMKQADNNQRLGTTSGEELEMKLNSMQNTGSINYDDLNKARRDQNREINPEAFGEVRETMDISDLLREIQKRMNITPNDGGTNPYDGRMNSLPNNSYSDNKLNLGKTPGSGSYANKRNMDNLANSGVIPNIKHFRKMNDNAYDGLDDSSIGVEEWQQRRIEEQERRHRKNSSYSRSSFDRSRGERSSNNTSSRMNNGNVSSIPAEIRLISDDNSGELEFVIDKEEFVLGKNFNVVDGFIPYNEGISRVHCKIVFENGNYFLVDLGSLNGTYINGAKIPVKSHVPISVGDIIGIANLEFLVDTV